MNVEILQLSDIDISQLKLVKEVVVRFGDQDHSRWVFRTPRRYRIAGVQDIYLKIWNLTYIRRDNVLAGIQSGFYDEQTTPAFFGLIFQDGICRGYAMRKCTRSLRQELNKEYYQQIKEKSIKTGYFSHQFSRYHVMQYEGQYSLIDLEGIYPIVAMHKLADYHCHFDSKDYEEFIDGLYQEHIHHPAGHPRTLTIRSEPELKKKHFFVKGLVFLRTQASEFCLRTKMNLLKKNQTHLIQR
jgi:hypothetical protein